MIDSRSHDMTKQWNTCYEYLGGGGGGGGGELAFHVETTKQWNTCYECRDYIRDKKITLINSFFL